MTSSLRFSTLLAAVTLAGVPLAGAACNAQLSTVLSADGGGADSGGSSSGGAACTADQQCNADPTISSLRGKCVNGACVCNADSTATSDGKCGDGPSNTDAGELSQCVAKGGKCIPAGSSPPPNYQPDKNGLGCGAAGDTCWVPVPSSGAPVCYNDPGCNEDPSVSALLGTCNFGICTCNNGYVQPSGKCGGTPPPECATQAGTCRQMPATCNAGELESDNSTNMTCGDLIAAVCCLAGGSCKGGGREVTGAGWVPVDFYCCSASKVQAPPICVNGWKTCRPNETATSNPGGGC